MEQAVPTEWIAPRTDTDSTAAASVSDRTRLRRAKKFLTARLDGVAASDATGLSPVVQFAMGAIALLRTKLKGGVKEAAPLRMISQLALGGKKSLALVEADGLRFLVGGGADSVTVIVPVMASASAGADARLAETKEL